MQQEAPLPSITYNEAVAANQVRLYRSRHVIEVVQLEQNGPHICATCLFRVYPIKGGWRHDIAQVERMVEKAGVL